MIVLAMRQQRESMAVSVLCLRNGNVRVMRGLGYLRTVEWRCDPETEMASGSGQWQEQRLRGAVQVQLYLTVGGQRLTGGSDAAGWSTLAVSRVEIQHHSAQLWRVLVVPLALPSGWPRGPQRA